MTCIRFFISLINYCIPFFMIVLVLLQSSKSAGLSGAISGGAEQLFGKQKVRGFEAVLQRLTVISAVLFFVLAILVGYVA
ncbi:preprotein translocase subunit SecG [Ectobacillus funiculus]